MTASIRFRVDFGDGCSVGVGKIELLEGIAQSGSLAQAARQMRMSYRRAWVLLEDINRSFDQPVSQASVGGRGGGGVKLTAFGSLLVAAYRRLEIGLQSLAAEHLQDFTAHAQAGAARRRDAPRSVRRALRGSRRSADTVL